MTRSKILEKTGRTDIGRKLVKAEVFFDFGTGVTTAYFQRLGNVHDDILLLITPVNSLAIA